MDSGTVHPYLWLQICADTTFALGIRHPLAVSSLFLKTPTALYTFQWDIARCIGCNGFP